MKNIKKYKIAKKTMIISAILFVLIYFVSYAWLSSLSDSQLDMVFEFLENPIALIGILWAFISPFCVAIFAVGLMLKYRDSKFKIIRISLYFIGVGIFAIEFIQFLLALFGVFS